MALCISFSIDGRTRNIRIPLLIDTNIRQRPVPGNLAELELAATVLALVEHIKPVTHDVDFTRELTEVSNRYIRFIKKGLPAGVDLNLTDLHEEERAA
jgi:hypothetical protein